MGGAEGVALLSKTWSVLVVGLFVVACDEGEPEADAGPRDAAMDVVDARRAERIDATAADSHVAEASAEDASPVEAQACVSDAGSCVKPSFCPPPGQQSETTAPFEADGKNTVVIKFVEGAHVRLRDGALAIDESTMLAEDPGLLCCTGLDVCAAKRALREVVTTLDGADVVPSFSRDPLVLDQERASGRAMSGEYLSDLNLFYRVPVPKAEAAALLASLRANALIDVAYLQAMASLPGLP